MTIEKGECYKIVKTTAEDLSGLGR